MNLLPGTRGGHGIERAGNQVYLEMAMDKFTAIIWGEKNPFQLWKGHVFIMTYNLSNGLWGSPDCSYNIQGAFNFSIPCNISVGTM